MHIVIKFVVQNTDNINLKPFISLRGLYFYSDLNFKNFELRFHYHVFLTSAPNHQIVTLNSESCLSAFQPHPVTRPTTEEAFIL
jgi:hypothetical protein